MLKEKITDIIKKIRGNNDKKKMENLIVLIIILVITIIAINAIWRDKNDDKQNNKEDLSGYKKLAIETPIKEEKETDNLETRLEQILSKMDGVGKVNVMITYSQSSEIIPLQNETIKTSTIQEQDADGGKRETQETDKSTEIVYSANNTPETKTIVNPVIKGAIVIAEGASNATVKTNIVSAVEAITGLATYKVQVFEMKQ